jgi:hypothetical protein
MTIKEVAQDVRGAANISIEVSSSEGEVILMMQQPSVDEKDAVQSAPKQDIKPESDLSDPQRRIWVVTTACLPWRTGTAVNPLMRALALTKGRPKHYVTLCIPWLEDEKARKNLYGDKDYFPEGGKEAQEEYIRDYCRNKADSPGK